MAHGGHTKKNLIFFIVVIIGMIGIHAWQSMAENSTSKEQSGQIIENITPKEANALIQEQTDNSDFIILDVRTPKEFESARLENSVNLDFYSKSFRSKLEQLDKENIYLIYCRTGRRSAKTLQVMKELKFQHVYNMLDGVLRWHKEGLPLKK